MESPGKTGIHQSVAVERSPLSPGKPVSPSFPMAPRDCRDGNSPLLLSFAEEESPAGEKVLKAEGNSGGKRDFRLSCLSITLFLAAWEATYRTGLAKPLFISAPSRIAGAFWSLAREGALLLHVSVSLMEFSLGFLLAVLLGGLCGVFLGWNRTLRALFSPFVDFLNAVPRIALIPVMILWFGTGLFTRTVVVFLGAFFPIAINVSAGVRAADPTLVRCARSFGATGGQILRTVVLPGAIPFMVAGMRMAVGRALVGMVVAEFIVSTAGVGHMMLTAGSSFQTDKVFAGVFMLAAFGLLLTRCLSRLEKYVDSWRPAR